MCSETPSEGGKLAPLAVQEFGGSLVPLKAGSALNPTEHTTALATFSRHIS